MAASKRPAASWVVMGPEPHLASCQRCGATVPKPDLPIDLKEFVHYLGDAVRAHARCKPRLFGGGTPVAADLSPDLLAPASIAG
jgi:hypothetical protein